MFIDFKQWYIYYINFFNP